MRTIKIFIPLFVLTLILSFTGVVNAAPPELGTGKGPPDLEKIVFIHFAKDFPAGNPHGTPPGQDENKPGGGNNGGEKPLYKYSGLHWGSMPNYYVSNSLATNFLDAINNSFVTWDNASITYTIEYLENTDTLPDTLLWNAELNRYIADMQNVVGWKDLGNTNAIAITYIWYNTLTRELVDVDTALNSNVAYAWWQNSIDGDPDKATWTEGQSSAYDVDIQNIMTHEAGHWLVLDDLYQKPANSQTMYGISAQFELKKRSLESGDIAGIQRIYPNP